MMRTRLGSYVFGSFCSPITSAALRLVTRIRSGWPWTFLAPPARTHPPAKYAAARIGECSMKCQVKAIFMT
ncbi:hypothetical protein PAHAL_3G286700 [Panicum hallii]|uniref:Uncharacterized protein n=1 Tax=Panicum hallii TaxID=206008 RepID=A0A2T8KJP7_9POAL|nr:hypothetical protein PAHAL_3G286700 [Panicum hallii]